MERDEEDEKMAKKERLLKEEHEFDVFDTISMEIKDWKRFGRSIGLKNHILNIIEKNNPGNNYEMAYRCIENKIETSKEEIDWPFWKQKLLKINEGAIVDKIENIFPHFSAGTAKEVHMCFKEADQLGIIAHNANRKENFLLFHFDLMEVIDIYYGTAELPFSIKMQRENIKDLLFKEHKVLLQSNKYMFTNSGILECDICKVLGLVVPKNVFKSVASLKTWWESLEAKYLNVTEQVNSSEKKTSDLTDDLLKSIIEFMIGVTSFNVSDFAKSPRFESTTTKNDKQLVMSHPKIYP